MKSIKEIFAKKVDERQEKELLKVERVGFWGMYWMLFASIMIQEFFMQKGKEEIGAELIVFFAGSAIVVVGCARKGLWSYQSRKVPGVKAYLLYSLCASILGGLLFGVSSGLRWKQASVLGVIAGIACYVGSLFVITFISFVIFGTIAKKREKKLEAMAEQDYVDDEDEI